MESAANRGHACAATEPADIDERRRRELPHEIALASFFFRLRAGVLSKRRAIACSNCVALWKSPRQSNAVPSQASRYAASAVMVSSTGSTRFGGGVRRSERQRAEYSRPDSVH